MLYRKIRKVYLHHLLSLFLYNVFPYFRETFTENYKVHLLLTIIFPFWVVVWVAMVIRLFQINKLDIYNEIFVEVTIIHPFYLFENIFLLYSVKLYFIPFICIA